jgi:uncharacterized protein (DUF952 family)
MIQEHGPLIVHLCQRDTWKAAQMSGEYRPASLDKEGFIHCSRPDQILTIANRFYKGMTDLLALWIDPRKVRAEVRWDSVGDQVFPHIYGALNIDAVVACPPMVPGDDGAFHDLPSPSF